VPARPRGKSRTASATLLPSSTNVFLDAIRALGQV
jgi:hypothetical protein